MRFEPCNARWQGSWPHGVNSMVTSCRRSIFRGIGDTKSSRSLAPVPTLMACTVGLSPRCRGARLVLTFNASRNAFVGTVENTTEQTPCAVRVEVHLDGGTELGPTARTDVPSGGTIEVELPFSHRPGQISGDSKHRLTAATITARDS